MDALAAQQRPPNVNERTYQEVEYLKKNLGPVLTAALAEICIRRPADPIEYLGHWLLRWRYNEELKRRDVQNALDNVRQKQWENAQAGMPSTNFIQGVTPGYPNLPPGYGGPLENESVGEVEEETAFPMDEEKYGEVEGEGEAVFAAASQRRSLGAASAMGRPSPSAAGGKRQSGGAGLGLGGPAKSVTGGKRLSEVAPTPSAAGGTHSHEGAASEMGVRAPSVTSVKRSIDETASVSGAKAPTVAPSQRPSEGAASVAGGPAP